MTRSESTGGNDPLSQFGEYLRSQRRLAQMSLRDLADLTRVSNPYLSQLERGLHEPSLTVLQSLAEALGLSLETLTAPLTGAMRANEPASDHDAEPDTERAIRTDPRLNESQKAALLSVYQAMVGGESGDTTRPPRAASAKRAAKTAPGGPRRSRGSASP